MIKAAFDLYRQSIGIYLIFQSFAIYLIIIEGGWEGILIPLVFLKAIQYGGLISYYRFLRPDKLIYFMNMGRSIPRLWWITCIVDLIMLVVLITFLSP